MEIRPNRRLPITHGRSSGSNSAHSIGSFKVSADTSGGRFRRAWLVYLDASASAIILLISRTAVSTLSSIPFFPYSTEALLGSPLTPLP